MAIQNALPDVRITRYPYSQVVQEANRVYRVLFPESEVDNAYKEVYNTDLRRMLITLVSASKRWPISKNQTDMTTIEAALAQARSDNYIGTKEDGWDA